MAQKNLTVLSTPFLRKTHSKNEARHDDTDKSSPSCILDVNLPVDRLTNEHRFLLPPVPGAEGHVSEAGAPRNSVHPRRLSSLLQRFLSREQEFL